MKLCTSFLALAFFALTATNLRADSLQATVNFGAGAQTGIELPLLTATGETFTFTHLFTDVLSTSLETITATYVDVSDVAATLNVTEVCASVTIVGKAASCGNAAFSFTDLTLPIATIQSFTALSASVNADIASLNLGSIDAGKLGINISGGSGNFSFGAPPPPSGPGASPVPEPGSLALMATGLTGIAGVVRRRFVNA